MGAAGQGSLKEVNIKADMPSASDAVKRVTFHIRSGKTLGFAAVKLIHGYGSTGRGGRIRSEVRRYLEDQKRRGRIRDYIPGENFSIFDERTRHAFTLCGELRGDPDLERSNNGITIVVL
jgi:hypothetical protein